MTPSELYTLIICDSTAKAAAIAGDDSACAARCIEIADLVEADPPIEFSELGLIKIFATEHNPFAGGQFMAALRSMAESQEVGLTCCGNTDSSWEISWHASARKEFAKNSATIRSAAGKHYDT